MDSWTGGSNQFLPDYYKNCLDSTTTYLNDVVSFLSQYQWIYNFQLTKFFTMNAWDNIPVEWRDPLLSLTEDELHDLPYDLIKESWPNSMKNFLHLARRLSLSRSLPVHYNSVKLEGEMRRGMKPKKQHEVSLMASQVAQICRNTGCSTVVDVGAGLGYLSQVLCRQFDLRVLALECEQTRSHGAQARTQKQDISPDGMETVTFELLDTDASFHEFGQLLDRKLYGSCPEQTLTASGNLKCTCSGLSKPMSDNNSKCGKDVCRQACDTRLNEHGDDISDQCVLTEDTAACEMQCGNCDLCDVKVELLHSRMKHNNQNVCTHKRGDGVCLIGLHCCGSLTPAMIKLAIRSKPIRSMVCVSCCYHSMSVKDDICEHFPLSLQVTRALLNTQWSMSTFALRLAAQETRARWKKQTTEDHDFHTKNVGYRGLLEIVSEQDGKSLGKLKRRIARKNDYESFDKYLKAVCTRTSVTDSTDLETRLRDLEIKERDNFKFIEPFTALQVVVQPVLESLIIIDRLLYIQDQDQFAKAVPVFDELLSPRNMAIVLTKFEVAS